LIIVQSQIRSSGLSGGSTNVNLCIRENTQRRLQAVLGMLLRRRNESDLFSRRPLRNGIAVVVGNIAETFHLFMVVTDDAPDLVRRQHLSPLLGTTFPEECLRQFGLFLESFLLLDGLEGFEGRVPDCAFKTCGRRV